MKNVPKKIYLNFGFDKDEVDERDDFNDMTDVLWSTDKINDVDIEYSLTEREPINVKKIIAKYEARKAEILKARPDLETAGDFSVDGIKLFCYSEFITVLKENGKLSERLQSENNSNNDGK